MLLAPGRPSAHTIDTVTPRLGEAIATENRQAEAWLRLLRGCLLERKGDQRAVADLVHASQLFANHGEFEGEILSFWRLGVSWSRAGDLDNAGRAFELGLTLARAHGLRLDEGILVFNLGFTHGAQNEPSQYRVLTEQALAIFSELEDWDRVALSLCNLGGALVGLGALDEAEAAYARALPVAVSSNLVLAQGLILGGRGELAFKRGDLTTGVHLTEEAAAWFAQHGLLYDAVRQNHLTARGLLSNGMPERALRTLRGAYQLAERHGFRALVVQSGELLAEAYAAAGAHAEAYTTLQSAWAQRSAILRTEAQQRFAMLVDAQEATAIARQTLQAQDLANLNRQLREAQASQQTLSEALADQHHMDPLTQVLNREGLAKAAATAQRWARETGLLLAVLVFEVRRAPKAAGAVDHAAAERGLQRLVNRLRAEAREPDLVARRWSDVFVMILCDADVSRAQQVVERVQRSLAGTKSLGTAQLPTVEVAAGCTRWDHNETLDTALARAQSEAAPSATATS